MRFNVNLIYLIINLKMGYIKIIYLLLREGERGERCSLQNHASLTFSKNSQVKS
jgi:hypothetical protein